MKIKFGSIVVAGSGKIGGHVAARNRGGAYLRTKVTPVNPSSASQVSVRNRFTSLSQAWKALTAAQRASWNAAVADYARTDVFGDIKNPSGFNLFQRLNNNLLNVGESQISAPPVPGAVHAFTSLVAAMAKGADTATLTFAAAIPATDKVKVFATPGMSAGKSFVKSEYRQIAVLDNADVSPYNVKADYNAKFGAIPDAGLKVFFRLIPVNVTTGQEGTGIDASCVVAA
jgi:hypothetical protein